MNPVLISILLVAAAANIVLLLALLVRSSSNQSFAKEVREDLRVGREELRSSNREANETVAGGGRRQLFLPLTTIVFAGLEPSSLVHHRAV